MAISKSLSLSLSCIITEGGSLAGIDAGSCFLHAVAWIGLSFLLIRRAACQFSEWHCLFITHQGEQTYMIQKPFTDFAFSWCSFGILFFDHTSAACWRLSDTLACQ